MNLKDQLKFYRISEIEYEKICGLLGRPPQTVEWALFSALWSEHCSYKSSKIHLKKFAKTINDRVVNHQGENAGVVDLGQGEQIVFKMESHNHPSFIEPYQGAATGVGGILRDIFTMGARPIALANYLCFGDIEQKHMPKLVDGVVRGIAGYGNSVGVPTVNGQTNFDSSYNSNILVNAMAIGLLRPGESLALSKAKGVGNFVVYVGAKTGKDGVHGAAMASESFDENSEAKKPNVQIGDPYFEKLLIESCLEVLQKNLVVAIQDMGAAGLTSSSFEMASKGAVGMSLHLDLVPVRDSSILPEEILLSESQERMLLVCEPAKLSEIQKVFAKWGLDAVKIGEITSDKKMQIWWKSEKLTSIDPDLLVENAPVYERAYLSWNQPRHVKQIKQTPKLTQEQLQQKFSSVEKISRQPIYGQFDQRVGLRTVHGADHDVAILRLPDTARGLATAVGCRPSLMKLDAELGAIDAVMYPALQMSIKGAVPWAITDCLNFGNPEKQEIMTEFVASVEAICKVSLALNAPVISGNVSFYNETLQKNIISTPAIGVVGLRKNIEAIPQDHFQKTESAVYLLGEPLVQMNLNDQTWSGKVDIKAWTEFMGKLRSLSMLSGVLATQMVQLGGLGLSLLKMTTLGVGFKIEENYSESIFAENLYQAIFEIDKSNVDGFEEALKQSGIIFNKIGQTQSKFIELGPTLQFSISDLQNIETQGLRRHLEIMA